MQRKDSWCASFYCIRKPGEDQTRKSKSSELMEWAASKNRATCFKRLLIKLLRVECWQELVFSRMEIWWIDGSQNKETSLWTTTWFVHRAHGQIYCWWRWYGLWHRRRITHVVIIQIILAQGEWSSAKDPRPILKRCNTRQQQTFFNMRNVYVFDIGSICVHGKDLLRKNYIPSKIQGKISFSSKCSTCLKVGRFVMETFIFDWWWRSHQSLSRARRFTYSQILCYALERWARTHYQMLSGRTSWRDSTVHHNTELWTQFMVSQWNSSEYFLRIHHIAVLLQKSESSCRIWAQSQKISQDGSSSCQCLTTFHGDPKKKNGNANWTPNSFLCMQKDFHQENGNSSDLDQKRSGILLTNTNHKENGTESQSWWWSNSVKADTRSSVPRVHCPEERSQAKVVENCQYTSALMRERLKLFFAQLFLLMSSVFPEQSQNCVKNAKLAMLEQGDLFWQDNLTHCLFRKVRWWKHLHLRPMILRKKKIYCKDTKNELKGYHYKPCD